MAGLYASRRRMTLGYDLANQRFAATGLPLVLAMNCF